MEGVKFWIRYPRKALPRRWGLESRPERDPEASPVGIWGRDFQAE